MKHLFILLLSLAALNTHAQTLPVMEDWTFVQIGKHMSVKLPRVTGMVTEEKSKNYVAKSIITDAGTDYAIGYTVSATQKKKLKTDVDAVYDSMANILKREPDEARDTLRRRIYEDIRLSYHRTEMSALSFLSSVDKVTSANLFYIVNKPSKLVGTCLDPGVVHYATVFYMYDTLYTITLEYCKAVPKGRIKQILKQIESTVVVKEQKGVL